MVDDSRGVLQNEYCHFPVLSSVVLSYQDD